MSENEVVPLFVIVENGEAKGVLPRVTDGKSVYKTNNLITDIGRATEDDVRELVAGDRGGEITVAAYVLMESLLRAGLNSQAATLIGTPSMLQQAALWCAIGMQAGRQIPEGVRFETATTSTDPRLRDLAEEISSEND